MVDSIKSYANIGLRKIANSSIKKSEPTNEDSDFFINHILDISYVKRLPVTDENC